MDQREVEALGMDDDRGGSGLGAIPRRWAQGLFPREMGLGRRWACGGVMI
jgi:hypothetical protein